MRGVHRSLRENQLGGRVLGEVKPPGPGWNYYFVRVQYGDEHLLRILLNAAGFDETAIGCPRCDGTEGLDARDQLEALMRRGGRRADRISVQVKALDERFLRATSPQPFSSLDGNWWRYRYLN
jgi:hypothetical protein